jgi:hypothetical protein
MLRTLNVFTGPALSRRYTGLHRSEGEGGRDRHAIDEFIQWYCSEPRLSFNKIVVTHFRIFLENRGPCGGDD